MKHRKPRHVLIAAAACAAALMSAPAAFAHEGHERWEYRGHEGYYWHRHPHHPHYPEVVRERIVLRESPPVYYSARPAYYGYPGVVIGIDVPPLVIPLR